MQTQTQVTCSILETWAARSMQRQFQRLMSESLPDEQRRQVSEELWSTRLLTFGLARHLDGLNAAVAPALSLVVHEEVLVAKALLCREGTPSSPVSQVLSGRLSGGSVCMRCFSHSFIVWWHAFAECECLGIRDTQCVTERVWAQSFHLLAKQVYVIKISWATTMPNFTEGIWVGELALVSQSKSGTWTRVGSLRPVPG